MPASSRWTDDPERRTIVVTPVARGKERRSIPEVSKKTGLTSGACVSRAIQLRRKGVRLPRFRRGKKGLDVAGLNALIKKMATKRKR